MRIASVEQVELGNIMELSVTGHVLKWARQSRAKKYGWNLKNHSHLTVVRHLREMTHSSLLIVDTQEFRNEESAVQL